MTELQKQMLKKIARSEYSAVNGSEPDSLDDIGQVWADTIIEDAQDKGVFTSLLKEDFVFHTGTGDKDAGVGLTTAGFAAYKKV